MGRACSSPGPMAWPGQGTAPCKEDIWFSLYVGSLTWGPTRARPPPLRFQTLIINIQRMFIYFATLGQEFQSCFQHVARICATSECIRFSCQYFANPRHAFQHLARVDPNLQRRFEAFGPRGCKRLAQHCVHHMACMCELRRHRQFACTGACAGKLLVHSPIAHWTAWCSPVWHSMASHCNAPHRIA